MAAIQYSVSTLHCLTVSLAHGGAGIGTVFGEQLARELLTNAGFEDPPCTLLRASPSMRCT